MGADEVDTDRVFEDRNDKKPQFYIIEHFEGSSLGYRATGSNSDAPRVQPFQTVGFREKIDYANLRGVLSSFAKNDFFLL